MSNQTTVEFRVTRPTLYTAPGCPGHTDVGARQGYYYYIRVDDAADSTWPGLGKCLLSLIEAPLPGDSLDPIIDIQRWNSDANSRIVRRYYWDDKRNGYRFLRQWESERYNS